MASRSLLEIRRAVGHRSGDMIVVTATEAGSTTALTDRNNLWLPDTVCRGRLLLFMDGSNAGENRVVTANTQTTTTVEWGVVLPVAVAEGDTAELWRKRGQGFDPVADVNTAINDNIRIASDYTWSPDMQTIAATFDALTGYLTIPADVRVIAAVEYEDRGGFWNAIPLAGAIDNAGWSLNRGNGTIDLSGPYASMANNRSLRLRVMRDLDTLATDADTTPVSFEWLVAQTVADLLGLAYTRQEEDRGLFNRWQAARQLADERRPAMVGRLPMDSQTL